MWRTIIIIINVVKMSLTNNELAHVAPLQVAGGLVQDRDADAALDALVQQEQTPAGQLVAVLHHLNYSYRIIPPLSVSQSDFSGHAHLVLRYVYISRGVHQARSTVVSRIDQLRE